MLTLFLLVPHLFIAAQWDPNGPTETGLPQGCVGSYPNITDCLKYDWNIPYPDRCAPSGPYPVPGQQVYIKDPLNFCIALPNPKSIFLQNNYYLRGKLPTIVQAEGFVQSFCMGDYLPPGSLPMNKHGIRSAHVVKFQDYYQIHGHLDCDRLNINCTMSAPGAYDDAGQYDNVGFKNCGKEPYSGVDSSPRGNAGMGDYVQMAGNGIYCMRVCLSGTLLNGNCNVLKDTAGCEALMGVSFNQEGFTYRDATTGSSTTFSVALPPCTTTVPTVSVTIGSKATVSTTVGMKSEGKKMLCFISFLNFMWLFFL